MKLIFSSDNIRNPVITDVSGRIVYRVRTPKAFYIRMNAIWKNTDASSLAVNTQIPFDKNGDVAVEEEDVHDADDDRSSEAQEEQGDEKVELEGLAKLAEIHWHVVRSTTIQWFGSVGGVGGLSLGEVRAKDFIPSRGITRRYSHSPDIHSCYANLYRFKTIYLHRT